MFQSYAHILLIARLFIQSLVSSLQSLEAFAPLFSSFQCWLEELKIVLIPEGLSVLKFHSDMPWGWSVSSTGLGAQWALLIWQLSSFCSVTFSQSYLNSFHPSILSVSLSETPFRQMLDVLVQSSNFLIEGHVSLCLFALLSENFLSFNSKLFC